MKNIIIVCAGGFGREVYYLICRINDYAKEHSMEAPYNILGFIDDGDGIQDFLNSKGINSKYLGTIKDWQPIGNEVYALGVSRPATKEKIVKIMKPKGAHFETLVRPDFRLPYIYEIGEGCIISPYSMMENVKIGNFVNIAGSMIGDAEIGDYCTTTGFSNITNNKLGKRVFVGSQAVILNGIKIGDDVTIGAGSVVVRNVSSGKKVFGNPAKTMEF